MQEDKEAVFDAFDQIDGSLRIFAAMLPGMRVNVDAMHAAASSGFSTATDLADALVRAGVSFRDAHEIVGKAVALCIREGKQLHEMSEGECAGIDARLTVDMVRRLSVEDCVAARDHVGGTAPAQVRKQVDIWKKSLEDN
jgi:argininosuccinate lyase